MSSQDERRVTIDRELIRHIDIKGSVLCPLHPGFCTCVRARQVDPRTRACADYNFVLARERVILGHRYGLLFDGNDKSANTFKQLSDGDTPKDIATGFLDGTLPVPTSTLPFIEPATTREALVDALLHSWAERVKQLRSMWKTKEEILAGWLQVRRAENGEQVRRVPKSALLRPDAFVDQGKAICEIIFGPPGHRVQTHAVAWLEGGVVRYMPVDIANCHVGCGDQRRDAMELMMICS